MDYTWNAVRSGKWSWSATWLPIVCSNLLSRVPGIRRRKPSNLLLYRKPCEVWGKHPPNMKRFNRLVEAFDLWPRSVVVYHKVPTTGRAMRCGSLGMFLVSLLYEGKCLRIDHIKINCCLNVPFSFWCGSCRVFIALAERMAYLL